MNIVHGRDTADKLRQALTLAIVLTVTQKGLYYVSAHKDEEIWFDVLVVDEYCKTHDESSKLYSVIRSGAWSQFLKVELENESLLLEILPDSYWQFPITMTLNSERLAKTFKSLWTLVTTE